MTKEEKRMIRNAGLENYLRSAYYDNFVHLTTHSQNELAADLYDKYSTKRCHRNYGCGSCIMTIYKFVGKLYFETPEEPEKEPKKPENKAKRGRPRKNIFS